MSTPALLAVIGILAGILCLALRRAERHVPDPNDTGLRSDLADALTGAVAWVSVVPMIATLAMLSGTTAAIAALAALALAVTLPAGDRLIRLYRAQVPLAATAFLLSIVSGMSIVSGAVPEPS